MPVVSFALLAGTLILAGVVRGSAQTRTTQPARMVTLATATPGGGFPLYGDAFAKTVMEADPALGIETRNTKGSTENVPLLKAGKVDLALVQGEVATETFENDKGSGLKIIAAMYSTAGMFVVRGDSPYHSILDLAGKPVVFGARGSGLVLLAYTVLEGMNLKASDFQGIYLDRAGDGPAMVLDGRAAALWGGGVGWPGFETMAKSAPGARFIVPNELQIAAILTNRPWMRRVTVPANSYPGQTAPLESVGSWSFVLARPGLPDDVAYQVARALHLGEASFAKRLPQARETTAANTLAAAPERNLIHPGVLRYLREIGLVK